ncbi:bifunctional 3-(3-hydroxy-phenyl)propionate/3-hydroxycinnamic acid hydroxylase [Azospirillum sp. TSO35-2]|uniref:bifunctional 3-(3-hydroxy-phenyl)propionate/3-hydroxycinnamic acid hydroxylase MhpA n=1 Tax=Azospirillum sp. TSO35-2 TaxID=716796 RepID=UPI000D61552E|nr:bifunctional 3-(3-hydroxy-phenyl)propionate/3-hydroxycinnamic acid hydroxylase [Azospirillum sp. TSO35-2]PWC36008.1 3-(3-hydroxyphenyl)propionate hydroxylase [Azospirillum sp. TSO35-2]
METNRPDEEDFDVVIVGFGPVGATLAHLLGLHGVRTLVLERESAAYHLPRAVHFDDEVMRVFQTIGLADRIAARTRVNPGMRFLDADGRLLLDWPRPQEVGPQGWHASYRVHQPDLEAILRDGLAARDDVEVRTRCDAFAIEERGDHVHLRYEDMSRGRIHRVRARYVVGCDGARSLVRRFIETGMEDYGFHERWLVVDVLLTRPKPELGDHSIQHCNPARPATYVRGPENRRRWEITVLPDENSARIATAPEVWRLLAPWITPDEAELERAAVYTFHSLIAERWRRGRLFLAGDAAHQTPPFMGQGMCAGIRDAANLGWKLALALDGPAGESLLDSYQSERHPNVREYITTAVRLGRLINTSGTEAALRAAFRAPDGAARMESIYPPLGPGLGTGPQAGRLFGQPRLADGRRLDDVTGAGAVLVAEPALVAGLRVPATVALVTTADAPDAAGHLARFGARAVLLRPDRYILGTAETAEGLADLLAALPLSFTKLSSANLPEPEMV